MIAVVLIKTDVGNAFSVCKAIEAIHGINMVDVVTGPYDVVAVIDSADVPLRVLIAAIHDVQGVIRTETCIALA